MADRPVVAVIATHGEDRLHFLLDRALASISRQTLPPVIVFVVSDNDPENDVLLREDSFFIKENLPMSFREKVHFIPNVRTRRMSGTGSWNTGILAAFSIVDDCWIALLDDDDEWEDDHIEKCLAVATKDCQWVVSGIIRFGRSGPTKEPILNRQPTAADFFDTNPGVQGSNMFVRVGSLLKAGLFDESLASTTDRDICIRLSDILDGEENSFASTGEYTVKHYADSDRPRVSSSGSAKIQGLTMFYLKHASRMTSAQRGKFKERAEVTFGCKRSAFTPRDGIICHSDNLQAWSGDELPLFNGTVELLPQLYSSKRDGENQQSPKKNALFGIITSDLQRILPLMNDLSSVSVSSDSRANFIPFIVIFSNSNDNIADSLTRELRKKELRGIVLKRSNKVVDTILKQSFEVNTSVCMDRLPIALSRTVLQVFIFNVIGYLSGIHAIVIMDDDKRLPMGWSPFVENSTDLNAVLIGRDLRTPPNPSLFSLRTNLVDLLYKLDMCYMSNRENDVESYCLTCGLLGENKFDWYYDLSSSRFDHLEMPVYNIGEDTIIDNEEAFFRGTLHNFLIGTPLCRDVIPLEHGDTLQRGGCMVLLKKNENSFLPLAVQQHAPVIKIGEQTTYSRRSDSFWCQHQKKSGLKCMVDKNLFVYHNNQFDLVPSPQGMRISVVEEVIGSILCRDKKNRKLYKESRLVALRSWLFRLRGILSTLRRRPYYSETMNYFLILPLEKILDSHEWEDEVFSVIESSFALLADFVPRPRDFSKTYFEENSKGEEPIIQLHDEEKLDILREWNKPRIDAAQSILFTATGTLCTFVGIGAEGVSFKQDSLLYKVFDAVDSTLPSPQILAMFNASFVDYAGPTPILQRTFLSGTLYRGGHGPAMIRMLKYWKSKPGLYHTNISPDNLLLDYESESVTIIDIGKDLKYDDNMDTYTDHFKDMCRRAFICYKFGKYGGNAYTLGKIKILLSDHSLQNAELVGFENFLKVIMEEHNPSLLIIGKLDQLESQCCMIVATSKVSSFPTLTTSSADKSITTGIKSAVSSMWTENKSARIALIIEDPYSIENASLSCRRRLGFYRRILRRMQNIWNFSIQEDDVRMIDQEKFGEYTKWYFFVLTPDPGLFLLIKSCPMEHKVILSSVRRIVQCLEKAISFKSIILLADVSKQDNFNRQFQTSNMLRYNKDLDEIQEERLVDHLLLFDGKDNAQVLELNKRWLGHKSNATHSEEGQQYASTFFAFQFIEEHDNFCKDDLVLQVDSDIIFHCENGVNGIEECQAEFLRDTNLITFGFPVTRGYEEHPIRQYSNHEGFPLRMEIRCSFIHLRRMMMLLPFKVQLSEAAQDNGEFCLRRGWWHTLDYNIRIGEKKSCRGTLGNGTWFFIHPPNEMKHSRSIHNLHLVSDLVSFSSMADLVKKNVWECQKGNVDLQTLGSDWLQQRSESVVVVFHLLNTSQARVIQSFEAFMHQMKDSKVFKDCGVVLVDNASTNFEDVFVPITDHAHHIFGSRLTVFCSRYRLPAEHLRSCLRCICTNPSAIIFIFSPNLTLNLRICILPQTWLTYCAECESYNDQLSCPYCDKRIWCGLTSVPVTDLPCKIPAFGNIPGCIQNTTFYATDAFKEGNTTIELAVCVKGNETIGDARDVCVRLHSECLTGDVFYSCKCDCGEQKIQFMHIMKNETHAVLLYIKGHEGRGNGLHNKIKAYSRLDKCDSKTHVDALLDIGCQSDVRSYNAAFDFLKNMLRPKSIRLYSNNPEKLEGAVRVFGPNNVTSCPMPAIPGKYNDRYLKEKKDICGHIGLIEEGV